MQITFDPKDPAEVAIVRQLLGDSDASAPAEPEAKPPAKRAAAKKAAAPKPDPEPEEDGPTLQDCVDRAQELVGKKKVAEVKAAVAEVGAERVSLMDKPEQFKKFLELVKDADDAADDGI